MGTFDRFGNRFGKQDHSTGSAGSSPGPYERDRGARFANPFRKTPDQEPAPLPYPTPAYHLGNSVEPTPPARSFPSSAQVRAALSRDRVIAASVGAVIAVGIGIAGFAVAGGADEPSPAAAPPVAASAPQSDAVTADPSPVPQPAAQLPTEEAAETPAPAAQLEADAPADPALADPALVAPGEPVSEQAPPVELAPPPPAPPAPAAEPAPAPAPAPVPPPVRDNAPAAASPYYQNCDAVRAAGAAPIYQGTPGYAKHLDKDGDGIGCDKS